MDLVDQLSYMQKLLSTKHFVSVGSQLINLLSGIGYPRSTATLHRSRLVNSCNGIDSVLPSRYYDSNYSDEVWFGIVKASRPSKQLFIHVGTEPPLPGYYQYFSEVIVYLLKDTTRRSPTSVSGVRVSTTRPPRSPAMR